MNIWERLGIKPTADRSEIRSAYAQMAKSCHPEEHPEEFKELQKAYKAALQYAKYRERADGIHGEGAEPESEKSFGPASLPTEPYTDTESKDGSHPEEVSVPEHIPEPSPQPEEAAPEDSFDFSEIDSYGEQEQFFRLFFLTACNPCLINNSLAWEIFLQHPSFRELFHSPDFRLELVYRICGLHGLKRETVLLFERHLQAYQNQEPEGVPETELACFRRLKRRRIRFAYFGAERFTGKTGTEFQNTVMTVFDRQGRIIDLSRKADVEDYMSVYFSFACANEEKLTKLYQSRKADQIGNLACVAVLVVCILIGTGEWLAGKWDESREQAAYAQEMERMQEDPVWIGEMQKRAEEDMDHILHAYQEWVEEQDGN